MLNSPSNYLAVPTRLLGYGQCPRPRLKPYGSPTGFSLPAYLEPPKNSSVRQRSELISTPQGRTDQPKPFDIVASFAKARPFRMSELSDQIAAVETQSAFSKVKAANDRAASLIRDEREEFLKKLRTTRIISKGRFQQENFPLSEAQIRAKEKAHQGDMNPARREAALQAEREDRKKLAKQRKSKYPLWGEKEKFVDDEKTESSSATFLL